MMDYYFTFRSITSATQAERSLQKAGIRAELLRTPLALRKHGCGYSLRVGESAFAAASVLLHGSYQKQYKKQGDLWQEVLL